MLARIIVFGVLLLSGAALAADHFAILRAGGNTLPIRTGEGGTIAAGDAGPAATAAAGQAPAAPARPRFCGFAPCGMPLRCEPE